MTEHIRGPATRFITIAEAAILTRRSKSAIYRLIRADKLPVFESPRGQVVSFEGVHRALAEVKLGRPRGTGKDR